MKFSFRQFIVPNFWKRLAFMLPAVLSMGVFVSILIEIGWGTDPASYLNLNLSEIIHLGIGTTEIIVYGLMLVFTIFFGAELIGFGSLANMFLIGYVIDFCRWLWLKTGFHDFILQASFLQNLFIFTAALLLFVLGAAIYMNAQMGVAPYDAIPIILSKWLPKIPFFIVRIVYDLSAVGIGVIFGLLNPNGIQGSIIGSIAMSLLLGPVITLVGKPLKKFLA